MKTLTKVLTITIFIFILCSSCGKYIKTDIEGYSVKYSKSISVEKAENTISLFKLFNTNGIFKEQLKIDENGMNICLFVVPKKGNENDENIIGAMKFLGVISSTRIFLHQNVDIAISNEKFEPIRIVPFAISEIGTPVFFDKAVIYYLNIELVEVNKFYQWISENWLSENKELVTFQIYMEGQTVVIKLITKTGIENDNDFVNQFKFLGAGISKGVFNNTPVDMHFADQNLKTLKVVPYAEEYKSLLSY